MSETTTGTVRWADGAPVEAVAVSDGVHWTHTDHHGRYALPKTPHPIWVRRPADGQCERWWQFDDAEGSEIDFTLTRRAVSISKIAHLSDPHLSLSNGNTADGVELANRFGDNTNGAEGLRAALSAAQQAGAQLAVITGDLTDHGTPDEYELLQAVLAGSPIQVEVIPGNHDHYGHRHEPANADQPVGGGFLGTATTWRYEHAFGPRWWSADIGTFHVLALDWFSYTCGIDCNAQKEFIRHDLDASERPLLVLTHDVPDPGLQDLITSYAGPTTRISILSGHWHVSVDRHIGQIHYLTAPPTSFGGFDWSAPSWHLLDVTQDHSLRRQTQHTWTRHQSTPAPTVHSMLWSAPDGHNQHGGNLSRVGQHHVAVPTTRQGQAHVTLVSGRDGHAKWTVPVDGDAVTSLTAWGDTLIATAFSGTLTCLDTTDGTIRWTHALPAADQIRLLNAPELTTDGTLITGTLDRLSALCADTGQVLWSTADLAPVDTLMTYGRGLTHGHHVVFPFGGPYRGLTALDARDGTVVWSQFTPPAAPSTVSAIPGTGDALVVRTDTQTLDRIALTTGSTLWSTPIAGGFTTTPPVCIGDRVVAITGDGTIYRLNLATGAPTADPTHIPQQGHQGWGPYRSTGIGIATEPLIIGDQIIAVTVTGEVWAVAPSGSEELAATLDQHVTTQPVITSDNHLIAQTTNAQLHRLSAIEPALLAIRTQGVHQ